MALSKKLRSHIRYFNTETNFWHFTKALTVKFESLEEILRYHEVLRDKVIEPRKSWERETQEEYANLVAPGSVAAWARELKTLFNLLGTAWVEKETRVKLTQAGEALLAGHEPRILLERQVRKYQIGNPQLYASLTGKIRLIPHKVLLELLLEYYPAPLTKDEFVIFVSKILTNSDIAKTKELLEVYRGLSNLDKARFKRRLDRDEFQKIGRVFSYAAHFLAFPRYLTYSPGVIEVADKEAAQRVLRWYRNGNDAHIDFSSLKDWFSHYGAIDASPSPMIAVDYYRKTGRIKDAVAAYGHAARRGLTLDDDAEQSFECRIQGEAALEAWLAQNLQKLEQGLTLKDRQFETEDAGRIDILARDKDDGYVVVELKRDKASDSALGQILRYIGWVRLNLLSDDQMVRGYVVGDRFDDRITYAVLSNDAIDAMCRLVDYKRLGVRLDVSRSKDGCDAQVVEISS